MTAGNSRFPQHTLSVAIASFFGRIPTRTIRSVPNPQRLSGFFFNPVLKRLCHPEQSEGLMHSSCRWPNYWTRHSAHDKRHPRYTIASMHYIYGINAVSEALKARGRAFEWVGMAKERHDLRLQRLIEDCRRMSVPVRFLQRAELDRMAGHVAHQGVVAVTSAKQYNDLDDVIAAKRGEYSLLVVLDGVEDPHNLGAILRTADAAGANEHLPIAKVTNISRTVEELKDRNVWTVGLDENGQQTYDSLDYKMDCAVVLGAEGKGLHDLVKKKCDFLVSIPMLGKVPSLNVSVAAAVVLYEIVRQRRARESASNTK